MLTQRNAIVVAMKERGWDVAEVHDPPDDWWADEHLALESRWAPVGARVFLTFLVDPQWEGSRMKGEAVWAVIASTKPLEQRPSSADGAWLTLGHGWESRLSDFVTEVDALRTTGAKPGSETAT